MLQAQQHKLLGLQHKLLDLQHRLPLVVGKNLSRLSFFSIVDKTRNEKRDTKGEVRNTQVANFATKHSKTRLHLLNIVNFVYFYSTRLYKVLIFCLDLQRKTVLGDINDLDKLSNR